MNKGDKKVIESIEKLFNLGFFRPQIGKSGKGSELLLERCIFIKSNSRFQQVGQPQCLMGCTFI
jgi:hypothetical protein